MPSSEGLPRGEASDREAIHGALDELFENARQFNSSKAYLELMQFIGRFRFYSPFNAMLIHIQMPGARFVATARRWGRDFHRQVKGWSAAGCDPPAHGASAVRF